MLVLFGIIFCIQPVSRNLSSHNYAGQSKVFNKGYLTGYRTVVGNPVNTVMDEMIWQKELDNITRIHEY